MVRSTNRTCTHLQTLFVHYSSLSLLLLLFLPILLKRTGTSEVPVPIQYTQHVNYHAVHTVCSSLSIVTWCVCTMYYPGICCCCGRWLNVILPADQLRSPDLPTLAPVENHYHTAYHASPHQSRNSGSRGGANPFSNSYAPIALGQVSHPEVIGQYGQQRPISLSPLSQCNKKC